MRVGVTVPIAAVGTQILGCLALLHPAEYLKNISIQPQYAKVRLYNKSLVNGLHNLIPVRELIKQSGLLVGQKELRFTTQRTLSSLLPN